MSENFVNTWNKISRALLISNIFTRLLIVGGLTTGIDDVINMKMKKSFGDTNTQKKVRHRSLCQVFFRQLINAIISHLIYKKKREKSSFSIHNPTTGIKVFCVINKFILSFHSLVLLSTKFGGVDLKKKMNHV